MFSKNNLIISIFGLLLSHCMYSQSDSSLLLSKDLLQADDIQNLPDSNKMKVSSATRSDLNPDDLPFTIYVVTREEIISNQYYSLTDVLKSVPGIRVSQSGSGELGESFQIRGMTGNFYSKILINGIPVKPSVVSGMPLGAQLPIRQAERIEIIFGPAATIYGADAASGVINIITRKADLGSFAHADIQLGANEYSNFNFMVGGKAGKNNSILQYSFFGSKTEFNNMNIRDTSSGVYNPLNYYQGRNQQLLVGENLYYPNEINSNVLDNENVSSQEFINTYYGSNYEGRIDQTAMQELPTASHLIGLQLDYKGFSFSYFNMYRRTHSSIGLTPVLFKYNNPQNFWGENIQLSTISYRTSFGKVFSTSNLISLSYRMDNNSSFGVTFIPQADVVYRYSASDDLLFEQIFNFAPGKNMEAVAGFSIQNSGNLPLTNYLFEPFYKKDYRLFRSSMDETYIGEGQFGYNPLIFRNAAAFMQSYYQFKKFHLMTGIRYDYNSSYGGDVSPRGAILYKLSKKTFLKTSGGYAYKAPPSSLTFESLAYPVSENSDSLFYKVLPNQKLLPENYRSLEVSIVQKIGRKIEIDQSFFINRFSNHIVMNVVGVDKNLYPLAVNDSAYMQDNRKDAFSRVFGSQTSIRFTNLISSIGLNAEINIIYANRKDEIPGVKQLIEENFKLMPKHQGMLKISFKPEKNTYVHIQSTWMTKWLRLFLPYEDIYEDVFNEVDGYYTVDVTMNYKFGNSLNGFVKVINLLDERYGGLNATFLDENLPYNPQIGRNIRFGLSFLLN